MTDPEKEKSIEEILREENQALRNDLHNQQALTSLRDTSTYRFQKLSLLQRIAEAQERQAQALEENLAPESEDSSGEEADGKKKTKRGK